MYQQYMVQIHQSLANLSSDELKELLNDDDKLDDRINEVVLQNESEKDTMLDKNRELAEENLSKEPELIEKRGRINELAEEGKQLCTSIQEKLTEIKSKSSNMNQDTVYALIQTAAAESEEESEKLVKQLLEKEVGIDEFLEQFLVSRKTMHMRRIKSDKMKELMRQNQRGSTVYPPSSGFYPSSGGGAAPYPTSGNTIPYPMGPIHMPMPGMFGGRQY